jgi:mono/diheme cytochrome c family protein
MSKILATWLATALLAVPSLVAAAEPDPRIAGGQENYVRMCASCHGASGRGDGPIAEDLRVPPADLTAIKKRSGGVFPDPKIIEIIDGRRRVRAHGPRDMPVWGKRLELDLGTPQQGTEAAVRGEMLLLVEYLKSIQVE